MAASNSLKLLNHHAYLLIGSGSVQGDLISLLEKEYGISNIANPDFFNRSYETFTIDNAREVKTSHSMRPVSSDGKKIFILSMNAATVEAQNALLKLLEEPAEYAHFFIIIPSAHLLLPTVKSRMQELFLNVTGEGTPGRLSAVGQRESARSSGAKSLINPELLKSAQKFVTLSKSKKLEEVKKLVDEISKEKKTKQDAIDLLDAIQAVIYEEKGIKDGKPSLEAIETARTYIHDRAPSVKMLLEFVMLNL